MKNQLLFHSCHLLASFDDFWFLYQKKNHDQPSHISLYIPSRFHRILTELCLFWNHTFLNHQPHLTYPPPVYQFSYIRSDWQEEARAALFHVLAHYRFLRVYFLFPIFFSPQLLIIHLLFQPLQSNKTKFLKRTITGKHFLFHGYLVSVQISDKSPVKKK